MHEIQHCVPILVQKTRKEGMPIRKISWEGSKLHRARKEKDNASGILLTLHLDTLTLLGTFHLLAAPPPPILPPRMASFYYEGGVGSYFLFFKGAAQIWTLWINFSKAPPRMQPPWFFSSKDAGWQFEALDSCHLKQEIATKIYTISFVQITDSLVVYDPDKITNYKRRAIYKTRDCFKNLYLIFCSNRQLFGCLWSGNDHSERVCFKLH